MTYFLPNRSFMSRQTSPRNKEKVISDSGAHSGDCAVLVVMFQRVPLFLRQNVPFQAVRGGTLLQRRLTVRPQAFPESPAVRGR